MTFKTTTCITVCCDECGVVLDYDDHIPHFETEAKALEAAETYDWFVAGGKHRCDDHAPVCSCDDCDHTPPCGYEACPGCERHAHNAISPTLTPLPLAEPADGTQAELSSEQGGAVADRCCGGHAEPGFSCDILGMRCCDQCPEQDDCSCDDPCCTADVGVGVINCGSQHCPVHGIHAGTAPTGEQPCNAVYPPAPNPMPNTRIVHCGRPTGHDGDHEEHIDGEPSGCPWPNAEPLEEYLATKLAAAGNEIIALREGRDA